MTYRPQQLTLIFALKMTQVAIDTLIDPENGTLIMDGEWPLSNGADRELRPAISPQRWKENLRS